MIDKALGCNGYRFAKQSLIKIMPYKVKNMNLNGKPHPCSLQSFCSVTGSVDGLLNTNYLILSDSIASELDKASVIRLLQQFGYKYGGVTNPSDYMAAMYDFF